MILIFIKNTAFIVESFFKIEAVGVLCNELFITDKSKDSNGNGYADETDAFNPDKHLFREGTMLMCIDEHERNSKRNVHGTVQYIKFTPAHSENKKVEPNDSNKQIVAAWFFLFFRGRV